jgi:crotonobetainyl-CoA:carnitine CoA-transferase CaiB-like acyl-CoA transferase
MDRPDLIDDPRFATAHARGLNASALDRELTAWTKRHSRAYLYREGQELHLPFGEVRSVAENVRSTHLAARAFWVTGSEGDAGTRRVAGMPFVVDGVRLSVRDVAMYGEVV